MSKIKRLLQNVLNILMFSFLLFLSGACDFNSSEAQRIMIQEDDRPIIFDGDTVFFATPEEDILQYVVKRTDTLFYLNDETVIEQIHLSYYLDSVLVFFVIKTSYRVDLTFYNEGKESLFEYYGDAKIGISNSKFGTITDALRMEYLDSEFFYNNQYGIVLYDVSFNSGGIIIDVKPRI